jgi:hypothetical protein
MYQNIVLSPTLLAALPKLPIPDLYRLLSCFATEKILCDAKGHLLAEYLKVEEDLRSNPKQLQLYKAFIELLPSNVRLMDVAFPGSRLREQWPNLENEFIIAQNDFWKIILAEDYDKKSVVGKGKSGDIEVAGSKEYLRPSISSRIKAESEYYKLIKGAEFDVKQLLRKYVKGSKTITIADGYIGQPYNYQYLQFLISVIDVESCIVIHALNDNARRNSRHDSKYPISSRTYQDDYLISEKISTLFKTHPKKEHQLVIHVKKSELRDRFIETEQYMINIGHALDAVDPITNKVIRHAVISVTSKHQL